VGNDLGRFARPVYNQGNFSLKFCEIPVVAPVVLPVVIEFLSVIGADNDNSVFKKSFFFKKVE
jgi:hypothetical protein